TAVTFSFLFCDTNAICQFFCDIPSVIRLSCSRRYSDEIAVLGLSGFLCLGCFVSIVASHARIFRAVLRMPTIEGRTKAFSTCLPPLSVVILFLSTASFAHLKPPSVSSSTLDLLVAVFYTVVPPRLQLPMYFLFRNLSVLDICGISVAVPQSIHKSLISSKSIYFRSCVAQIFLVILSAASEVFVLSEMSYDHYPAICRPLR
ncbi:olfactory receptor 14J1-like, partial [Tachyglossus aculeatus]|uniref:olfactory receptor 14J1-like n=1 Tax=Tachyglossus aculeatus TaxID=9261 RepID=UPI0018F3F97B